MANWDKIIIEGDVEDRRGSVGAVTEIGGVGAVLLIGAVLLFGGNADPEQIQQLLEQIQTTQTTSQGEFVDIRNYLGFVKKVIGSNNSVWNKELAKQSIKYDEPRLVLFRRATQSGCGGATSQVGPHYCPNDKTIYLDETFFEELTTKFGAKGGEVAEAYVMAHEIGHHVQQERGTFGKFDTSDNKTSVKVELQADCYAGVWAGNVQSQGVITESEIDQAIDAAAAVGDDRIQKSQGGDVNPESWTHGSSTDRKKWFLTGYRTKDATTCNTIS
jgi:uncharacterized protein